MLCFLTILYWAVVKSKASLNHEEKQAKSSSMTREFTLCPFHKAQALSAIFDYALLFFFFFLTFSWIFIVQRYFL